MGRPVGTGLNYFSLECGFFNDKKTKLIKSDYGATGVVILMYLLTRIYGDEGYYLAIDEDEVVLIADDIGCGVEPEYVRGVIEACVRRKIFNADVYETYHVLTSRGIQRRFLQAARSRDKVRFKGEYFLLTEEYLATEGYPDNLIAKIMVDGVSFKNTIVSTEKTSVSMMESTQRKEKKSKVNNKVKDNTVEQEKTTSTIETNPLKYADDNLIYLSPVNRQELASFRDDMPDEIIMAGIDAACSHGIRTWSYCKSILNAYLDAGYKTVGEIKAAEDKRKKDKTNAQTSSNTDEEVIWRV